jgi:hypothetical protein
MPRTFSWVLQHKLSRIHAKQIIDRQDPTSPSTPTVVTSTNLQSLLISSYPVTSSTNNDVNTAVIVCSVVGLALIVFAIVGCILCRRRSVMRTNGSNSCWSSTTHERLKRSSELVDKEDDDRRPSPMSSSSSSSSSAATQFDGCESRSPLV